MEHTIKRNGTYYYRRRIPQDLIAVHNGQREVYYSLRTKDRAVADRKARKASGLLDDEWDQMRAARPKEPQVVPSDWDLVEVGGKVIAIPPPKGGWPEPIWDGMTEAEHDQAEYEHQLGAEQDERDWEAANADTERVIAVLRARGLALNPAAADAPAHPLATPAKRTTLDKLIGHWERERKPNSKTVAKMKLAALEFDLLHKDPAVESITRPMVIAYRTHLLEQKKANGKPQYAKGTIDDRLSNLGTLLALAVDHGYVTANVAAKAALPTDKLATKARLGYTPEQAETIMEATEQYRETEPAKYWLPRLARWTGGRLNELHQLRKQDLAERDGFRGISIIDEGDHSEGIRMRMKNAASRRWVPLHPELAEFWTWATAQPSGPLFPAEPDKHGIVSTGFSKWYGRQRIRWGIADRRRVFHSWRHAFADMCRASGMQDSMRYALMGHAEGGAAGGYGSGELPPKALDKAVRQLTATKI